MGFASWAKVRDHVIAKYRVRDEGGWLGLAWEFDHQGHAIRQSVRIEPTAVGDEDWVVVVAVVCHRSMIDPVIALEHNATLAIGTIAFHGDACIVRLARTLGGLDARELDRALEMIPFEAARVRRLLADGRVGALAFTAE